MHHPTNQIGGHVKLFHCFQKCLVAFLFVIFCASAAHAADNKSALFDFFAQPVHPANAWSFVIRGIDSTDIGAYEDIIIAQQQNGTSGGPANGFLQEKAAIPLMKNGEKTIWSLSPSFIRFNLNPVDDIRNLALIFQLRF